jgi:hypothetical protein
MPDEYDFSKFEANDVVEEYDFSKFDIEPQVEDTYTPEPIEYIPSPEKVAQSAITPEPYQPVDIFNEDAQKPFDIERATPSLYAISKSSTRDKIRQLSDWKSKLGELESKKGWLHGLDLFGLAVTPEEALLRGNIKSALQDVETREGFYDIASRKLDEIEEKPVYDSSEAEELGMTEEQYDAYKSPSLIDDDIGFNSAMRLFRGDSRYDSPPQEYVPEDFPMAELISGERGVADVLRETNVADIMPFSPSRAIKTAGLYASVKELQNDDYPDTPNGRLWKKHDIEAVKDYSRKMEYLASKPTSLAGSITEGLIELPGFMVEFAVSGGLANAVGKSTAKTTLKVINEAFGESVKAGVGKAIKKGITKTAMATTNILARTLQMPHDVVENGLKRQIPGIEIKDGNVYLDPVDESLGQSILYGVLDTGIEVGTEMSGDALGSIVKRTLNGIKKTGLTLSPKNARKLIDVIEAKYKALKPREIKAITNAFNKVGIQGAPEEIGEEVLGSLLRGVTGTEEWKDIQKQWTGKQLITTLAVVSLPGMARSVANYTSGKMSPDRKSLFKGQEKLTSEEIQVNRDKVVSSLQAKTEAEQAEINDIMTQAMEQKKAELLEEGSQPVPAEERNDDLDVLLQTQDINVNNLTKHEYETASEVVNASVEQSVAPEEAIAYARDNGMLTPDAEGNTPSGQEIVEAYMQEISEQSLPDPVADEAEAKAQAQLAQMQQESQTEQIQSQVTDLRTQAKQLSLEDPEGALELIRQANQLEDELNQQQQMEAQDETVLPTESVKPVIGEEVGDRRRQSPEAGVDESRSQLSEEQEEVVVEADEGDTGGVPSEATTQAVPEGTIEEGEKTKKVETATVEMLPIENIKVDASQFQFKEKALATQEGVDPTERLKGDYQQTGSGNILVWEDKSGNQYVVNGHHRLDLAKRDKKVYNIRAEIIRESDGVSAEDARAIGAMINIMDGTGSVQDYAEFFRETKISEETAKKKGLLSRVKGQTGFLVGRFADDSTYASFKAGELSQEKAKVISDIGRGNEAIQGLGRTLAKKVNAEQLGRLLKLHLEKKSKGTAKTGDLFGFDDAAIQESIAIDKVAQNRLKDLRKDRDVLNQAVNKAGRLRLTQQQVNEFKSKGYKTTPNPAPAKVRALLGQVEADIEKLDNYYTDTALYNELRSEAGLAVEDAKLDAVKETEGIELPFDEKETKKITDDFQLVDETEADAKKRESKEAKEDEQKQERLEKERRDATPDLMFAIKGKNAKEVVDKIVKKFESPGKVVVIETQDELPQEYRKQLPKRKAGKKGVVEAFYHNGTTYIITGNIENIDRIPKLIAHEIGTHRGLRLLLGEEYDKKLSDIHERYKNKPVYKQKLQKVIKNPAYKGILDNPAALADETLALMAEENVGASTFKKILNEIKVFLADLGLKFSDVELQGLLKQSRSMVEGKSPSGLKSKGIADGKVMFSVALKDAKSILTPENTNNFNKKTADIFKEKPQLPEGKRRRDLTSDERWDMLEQRRKISEKFEKLIVKTFGTTNIPLAITDKVDSEYGREYGEVYRLLSKSLSKDYNWRVTRFDYLVNNTLSPSSHREYKDYKEALEEMFTGVDIGEPRVLSYDQSVNIPVKKTDTPMFSAVDGNELIVMHNTSQEKLEFADRMGGMALPSLAIGKSKTPFEGFGEISLLADKDIVDPQKSRKSKAFDADVYSPRYPSVTYKYSQKAHNKFDLETADIQKQVGRTYDVLGDIEREGKQGLKESQVVQAKFLSDNGKMPKTKYEKDTLHPSLRKFKKNFTGWQDLAKNKEFQDAVLKTLPKGFRERVEGNLTDDNSMLVADAAQSVARWTPRKRVNVYAMRDILRERTQNNAQFDKYVDELWDTLDVKEKVYSGTDSYGRQKWLDHNLSNVVKLMKRELRGGENFFYGVPSIRAQIAKQFRSISQIKADRDKIISQEEMEKVKQATTDMFGAIEDSLYSKRKQGGYGSIAESLQDVASKGLGNIESSLKEEFDDVTAKDIKDVKAFLTYLKDAPTEYFEVKLQREMGLDEFSGAVIPRGKLWDNSAEIMKRNNVPVKRYKQDDSADRAKKVDSFSDLRFSVASPVYPMAEEGTWYGEGDYKQKGGKIVKMTPDEFISKAKPLVLDEESKENIQDLKDHITSGGKLDPLTLYSLDKSSVRNSDGRHRAYASKELKIKEVPVIDYTDSQPMFSVAPPVESKELLYHGTPEGESITKLTPDKNGLIFFTNDKDYAQTYAFNTQRSKKSFAGFSPTVYESYIDTTKLFDFNNLPAFDPNNEIHNLIDGATGYPLQGGKFKESWSDLEEYGGKQLFDAIKKAGYTGIRVEIDTDFGRVDEVAVFSNDQIKQTPELRVMFSVAPPVESKAFKSWFKGSKVVDADGKPLVVYHGTKANFTSFDRKRIGETGDFGVLGSGFYFTDDIQNAENYARNAEGFDEPRVISVYLKIQNPFKGGSFDSTKMPTEQKAKKMRDALVKKGYDGIQYETGYGQTWYVAFSPNQIKSTDNVGTFDPKSDDIRFSVDPLPEKAIEVTPELVAEAKELKVAYPNEWQKKLQDKYGLGMTETTLKELDKFLTKTRLENDIPPAQVNNLVKRMTTKGVVEEIKKYRKGVDTGEKVEVPKKLKVVYDELKKLQNSITKKERKAVLGDMKQASKKLKEFIKAVPLEERGRYATLLDKLSNAKTPEGREKLFNEALEIIDRGLKRAEKRGIITKIKKAINDIKAKKIKGIATGKLTAVEESYLKKAQEAIDMKIELTEADSENMTEDEYNNALKKTVKGRIIQLQEALDENEWTEEEFGEYMALIQYGDMQNRSMEQLEETLKELEEVIETGKLKRAIEDQERRERNQEYIGMGVDRFTGGKGLKTPEQLQKEERTKGWVKKSLENANSFLNRTKYWRDLLDTFDLSKDKTYQGALTKRYSQLAQKATNTETSLQEKYGDMFRDAAQRIFNLKGKKLANRLNKNSKVLDKTGVKRDYRPYYTRMIESLTEDMNKKASEGKDVRKIQQQIGKFRDLLKRENVEYPKRAELDMSQNQAYKMWQWWQDPSLRNKLERHGYSETTMEQIENFMDDDVKEWAQWQLDELYPSVYADMNEVFKRQFYTEMPKNENYSPFVTDYVGTKEDDPMLNIQATKGSTSFGGMKERVDHNRAPKIVDGDMVLMRHIGDASHYQGWSETMREMRAVLGNQDILRAVEQYHGKDAKKVLTSSMDDFASGGIDPKLQLKALGWLRSNFTKAMIGMNLTTLPKQITSIVGYATAMPVKNWSAGTLNFFSNPSKWNERVKELFDNSPSLRARYEKGWERDAKLAMSKSTPANIAKVGKLSDLAMSITKFGDAFAVIGGGWAYYDYQKKNYMSEGMSEPDASKQATLDFEIETNQMQQSGQLINMNTFQRGGSMMQLFTMFASSPTSYFNAVQTSMRSIVRGKATAQDYKRLFIAQVVLPALYTFVANGYDWDNEEQFKAWTLGNLEKLFLVGDAMRMYREVSLKQELGSGELNILSFIRDYGMATRRGLEMLEDGEINAEDLKDAADYLAKGTGKLSGLPYEPVKRFSTGIYDAMSGDKYTDFEKLLRTMGYSRWVIEQRRKRNKK